jgi:hypothetical protein
MQTFSTILLSLVLATDALSAVEQRADGCNARDSKHYVVLIGGDEELEQSYELQIRSVDAAKPLFSRSAGGYAYFKAAATPANFKCLWSPDCKFVAIFERGTKRSGDTTIYALSGDKVQEIAFPDLSPLIRPHLTAEWRASWIRPEVWLPNHVLILSVEGTQMDEEHGVYRFILTLKLQPDNTGKFIAKIASFEQDHSIPWSIK